MTTRDTNPGPTIPGDWIQLAGRRRTLPNCRDDVIRAFKDLIVSRGDRSFTPREVYEQMLNNLNSQEASASPSASA
jgi:hypothetical protein